MMTSQKLAPLMSSFTHDQTLRTTPSLTLPLIPEDIIVEFVEESLKPKLEESETAGRV